MDHLGTLGGRIRLKGQIVQTIERWRTDPLWMDLGWTDQKATWHLINKYVVSKKS